MIEDGSGTAVAALSAAVRAQPGRGDLWGELATALVAAGRAPEAWDAAVRAVELAPRSAASHRAVGAVAAALGDRAQAETAYRHARLLDSAGPESPAAVDGGRHASDRATALAAFMASQIGTPDPRPRHADPDPAPWPNGSRHADPDAAPWLNGSRRADPDAAPWSKGSRHAEPDAAPWPDGSRNAAVDAAARPSGSRHAAPEEDPSATGRQLISAPSTGGRRRARDDGATTAVWPGTAPAPDGGPATAVWPGEAWPQGPESALESAAAWSGTGSAGQAQRATAVGLPGWLGRVGPTPGPDEWAREVPAAEVADPVAWRRGLTAVVRIEWLVGVVCLLGLASARTAPYTAGLLAGALVLAGAYGRRRAITMRRPPDRDRVPTYAAIVAAAAAVLIVPAAMAGALTLARIVAVAVVTSATVAAVLLARRVGKDIRP